MVKVHRLFFAGACMCRLEKHDAGSPCASMMQHDGLIAMQRVITYICMIAFVI